MYQLEGIEFSDLLKRYFTAQFVTTEKSGTLNGKFDCSAKNFRDEEFDILHFRSDFQDHIRINKLQDSTHVSLHFQLAGYSDALISGFNHSLPLGEGTFNLLNCVDPVSTFTFPEQQQYGYLCVGLNPAFFNRILEECGYERLLKQSENREPFTLFDSGRVISAWQQIALQQLQHPPVADNLRIAYIRSKVKEITLLTLGYHVEHAPAVPAGDVEKLHGVRDFLADNYLLPLTLEEISKTFLLNDFKLKSGFKQLFGVTVFGYIQQLRMEHAKALVTTGKLPVNEVAAIVGYASDSSFIRSFKRYYGFPPGKA